MKPTVTGKHWEDIAESFLKKRGLRSLKRNFHCRFGEIDLIMRDGPILVFIEVRYRRRSQLGDGAASIDSRKKGRIEKTAAFFLAGHPQHAARACRFDVISIGATDQDLKKNIDIGWIRDAFQAQPG